MLEKARTNLKAIREKERLEEQRELMAKTSEAGATAEVSEILADIRLAMKSLGVTQVELAERCGLTQPVIAAYLTGKREPGAKNLALIAKALGMKWKLTKGDGDWPMVID